MGLYLLLLASYCLAIIGLLYLKRSAIKVGVKTLAFALLCAAANQSPQLAPFLAPLFILLTAIDGAWSGALVALAGGVTGAATGKLPWLSAAGEVLFGSLLGFLLTLDYSDPLPRRLREPEVASVLASLVAWPTPLSFALASVPELTLKGNLLSLGKFFLPLPAIFLGALLFRLSPFYKPPPIRSGNPSPMARSTAMAFVSWFLALYLLIFLASIAVLTFVRTKSELEAAYDGLKQTLSSVSLSIQRAEKLADYILSLPAGEREKAITSLCPSSCSIVRPGDSLETLPPEEREALARSWPLSRPYYSQGNWLFALIRTQGPEKLLVRVAIEKPNLCFWGKEPNLFLCPVGVPEDFGDKIVLKGENALAFLPVGEVVGRINRFIALFALVQLFILLSLVAVASVLTSRLTRPLEELSRRAVRLAGGNLDENLSLVRDDEIGKLARALEKMRQYLRQRMDESYALLRISQKALSEPELEKGIEILLSGLRDLTKAAGAAFVILDKNGLVSDCIALGRIWQDAKGKPPSACSRLLAIQGEPVVIPFIREAPIILREALQEIGARSAIGIPLQNGLLWFTFPHPLQFSSSELSLINAIAGQLDVMAENLKLLKGLEKQKAYLETILRSTLDPILVVDELGRLVTLNPAAEEALGIKGASSLGLPLIEKLREQPWREFMEQLKGARVPFQAEIPSSQGVTFHVKAYPLLVDGNFRGWVIAMRDITPLKEAERSRTEALEIAFHDLYTPLTLIRDYAKTLGELGGLNEKQKEVVEKLVRNAEHSSRLVRNFLDISRMEAGRMKLTPCWLGPLVEEAVAEVAERAEEKGLSLEVHLEEAYPFVGDREFVKRAIVNLLDNAIKYTPAPGKVTVSVDDAGRFWVLRVQDTGIGIPYSEQPRIFEKFYRGKEAESLGIRGSGLGLALVKAVAEKHRGKVWVESAPGKGSTFFLAIPKAQRTELLEGR